MKDYLNPKIKDLRNFAEQNAKKYQEAQPFPNIVLEEFFSTEFLDLICDEFPDLAKKDSERFENAKQLKFAGIGEKFFGPETKSLMYFLNSEPFLRFLQILTGIKEPLIGDPYFIGGGQHEIKKGGLLKIHADFNKHRKLRLDRRINVLIYLNKNWKEEYGGHFELWDRSVTNCVKRISPQFNTMAIFSTTDFSYHGHPDPLQCPEDRSRKSLALYYYSNGRPQHEVIAGQEDHSTIFKGRRGNEQDSQVFKNVKAKTLIKDIMPPVLYRQIKKIGRLKGK
ncbi:MAG: 2OG-Fe(II) oxygenase [Candidatus Bathyarchaeota archaeon]|nr:2OG-Fe(II) oxygenase [Candidatus Bathyarchaeota archaeon]